MTKVTCPVCGKLLKELNNAHLKTHSLTVEQFDQQFPTHQRMSEEQRRKKNHYQHLSYEMSQKLKHSHTFEGFIDKYGEDEGIRRYHLSKKNKQQSKTVDNFKRLYGEIEGEKRYQDYKTMSKTKMSKSSFIQKYGEYEGTERYNQWLENNKRSKTLQGYVNKYGENEGHKKWFIKNNRNSKSSRKVNDQHLYALYKSTVYRFTRQALKSNTITNTKLVSKGQYVIDHKYSILEGFKHNVPPYIIGSQYNLEVISHHVNSSKQNHCSITLQELLATFFKNYN